MKRTHIWLPDDVKAAIAQAAARETIRTGKEVTPSEWVRLALTKALAKSK